MEGWAITSETALAEAVQHPERPGGEGTQRTATRDVAMVRAETDMDSPERTKQEQERTTGQLDEVKQAVSQVMATMHGIAPERESPSIGLGPVPTTQVDLEGVPVEALIDTGSPTSIVSLDCFLQVTVHNRLPSQTPTEWGETVRACFQPSTVALCSYGGGELDKSAVTSGREATQ